MKIYTRIKMNIDTWEVLEEDSYEYMGPMALAGGGGGGDTVDKEYNRRMAKIGERQQKMAEDYFQFWRDHQSETEKMRNAAERELIPGETALRKDQIDSERRLIRTHEDLYRSKAEYTMDDLEARKPLSRQYYQEAMKGENVERAAAQAGAGVAQEYDRAMGAQRREAARAGVDVNSGRFTSGLNQTYLSRARDMAGQKTLARQNARDRNFAKMDSAMNKQIGVGV
jgi:hypothetical protein